MCILADFQLKGNRCILMRKFLNSIHTTHKVGYKIKNKLLVESVLFKIKIDSLWYNISVDAAYQISDNSPHVLAAAENLLERLTHVQTNVKLNACITETK